MSDVTWEDNQERLTKLQNLILDRANALRADDQRERCRMEEANNLATDLHFAMRGHSQRDEALMTYFARAVAELDDGNALEDSNDRRIIHRLRELMEGDES